MAGPKCILLRTRKQSEKHILPKILNLELNTTLVIWTNQFPHSSFPSKHMVIFMFYYHRTSKHEESKDYNKKKLWCNILFLFFFKNESIHIIQVSLCKPTFQDPLLF